MIRIIHKQKSFMGVFLEIAKFLVTVFYHSTAVYIYIYTIPYICKSLRLAFAIKKNEI